MFLACPKATPYNQMEIGIRRKYAKQKAALGQIGFRRMWTEKRDVPGGFSGTAASGFQRILNVVAPAIQSLLLFQNYCVRVVGKRAEPLDFL